MADTGSGIADFPFLVITVIVGATVMVLVYISNLLRATTEEDDLKSASFETPRKEKKQDSSSQAAKASKKKHTEKWSSKDSKQSFTHPWLLTSLKGHSGRVLDMDFSSNGKFLGTCAEDTEELDPGGSSEQASGNSSGSEANKENSPEGGGGERCKGTLLSRRQKKNRIRREDSSPTTRTSNHHISSGGSCGPAKKTRTKTRRSNNTGDGNNNRRQLVVLRQHTKLNLADSDLSVFLRHYVLSSDKLLGLGYPVESALYPGRAIIYKNPGTTLPLAPAPHLFDVNAREFVPMSAKQPSSHYYDEQRSGNMNSQEVKNSSLYLTNFMPNSHTNSVGYSGVDVEWNAKDEISNSECQSEMLVGCSSSDGDSSDSKSGCDDVPAYSSQETCASVTCEPLGDLLNTVQNNFCGSTNQTQDMVSEKLVENGVVPEGEQKSPLSQSDEKKCVRCGRGFFVTADGEYLTQERCQYHWGKLQKVVCPAEGKGSAATVHTEYGCCRSKSSSRGCTTGKLHVWNGVGAGINGPYDGYVHTRRRKTQPPDGNFGVYALDCEMCFTTRGLELTKVTVVAADGRLVYDCLVRPENYIIDYNTRFSGITARDLGRRGATKSLRDVQNDLMGFINADTILIGHGLENDLRALRIIHGTVIDTSVIFPHFYGLPYRRSLKSLVGCYLKRNIQQDSSGHDSFEDARACIELMLWRIRKDFRQILESRK